MPRIIRTLWFEDIGFMQEPLIDTPMGKLSIRQTIIVLIFAFVAFLVGTDSGIGSVLPSTEQLAMAGVIFVVGIGLSMQKVKTIPIERTLMYMFMKPGMPKKAKAAKKGAVPYEEEKEEENVLTMVGDITTEAPKKVVVILRDNMGRPMKNKAFTAEIQGQEVGSGTTDEEGFSMLYFAPPAYGRFEIEVKPEGYSEAVSKITVDVQPPTGSEKK